MRAAVLSKGEDFKNRWGNIVPGKPQFNVEAYKRNLEAMLDNIGPKNGGPSAPPGYRPR